VETEGADDGANKYDSIKLQTLLYRIGGREALLQPEDVIHIVGADEQLIPLQHQKLRTAR